MSTSNPGTKKTSRRLAFDDGHNDAVTHLAGVTLGGKVRY